MTHCYIFDYVDAKIYHTTITDDVEDINFYVDEKLNYEINRLIIKIKNSYYDNIHFKL